MDNIAEKLYSNQTLCKYLYYDETDPLAQANIPDTSILYTDKENQKILYRPFTTSLDDNRVSKLAIVIEDVTTDETSYFKVMNLDCVICCHNEL
jgi:hypothetical protein